MTHVPELRLLSDLFAQASDGVAAEVGIDRSWEPDWSRAEIFDRPRSRIYRLTVPMNDKNIVIYAKRHYKVEEPIDNSEKAHIRQGLRIHTELQPTLARELASLNIAVPTVLATDLKSLTSMEIGFPGSPLGSHFQMMLRSDFQYATDTYYRLGRGINIIESVSRASQRHIEQNLTSQFHGWLNRLEPLVPLDLFQKVESLSLELLADPIVRDSPLRVHGDFSRTNILMKRNGSGLAIIDFGWPYHFPGFDLFKFIDRLESERWYARLGSRILIDALLDGYGTQSGSAPCRLTQLERKIVPVVVRDDPKRRRAAIGRLISLVQRIICE